MDFTVAVESLDGRVVVRVEGDLDLASAAEFEDALADSPDGLKLILDLGACTFLDSAGIRAIAAAVRRPAGVAIVASSPAVLRALELTTLDTMVSIHATLDDAS